MRRFGWRVGLAVCALVAIAAPGFCATGGSEGLPTAAEIDSIMRELSGITGFRIHRQLPFEMVTRDQVNRYLKDQIRRTVKADDVRAEEITLKKFGFVPRDFDLKQSTIDLLTEQAAAYYDFHRKKLFISDWASRNMRDEALVHELAHALADQTYSIQKFLSRAGENSEASMARETVVEGQASWLMLEYAARRGGRSLADPNVSREMLRSQMDAEDSAYPVFSKAPLYIRSTLMFPYEEGGKFQQVLFEKDRATAFSRPFVRPPASTSQVLHPERYFAGTDQPLPLLPKPAPHTRAFVKGNMGELDHRVLLRQYIGQQTAEELAPRLKNAAYRIDEGRADHRMTLIYFSDWSDEGSAAEYFRAYRTVLGAKWKGIEIASETPQAVRGKGDDGYFELTLQGTVVESREGFERPFAN